MEITFPTFKYARVKKDILYPTWHEANLQTQLTLHSIPSLPNLLRAVDNVDRLPVDTKLFRITLHIIWRFSCTDGGQNTKK